MKTELWDFGLHVDT